MRSLFCSLTTAVLLIVLSPIFAKTLPPCDTRFVPTCDRQLCCGDMGGINYCDSSAGRYVCNNGYYSSCYCDRHAVMDMQKFTGCCMWQGGVLSVETGMVICNNGGISEMCSLGNPPEKISSW